MISARARTWEKVLTVAAASALSALSFSASAAGSRPATPGPAHDRVEALFGVGAPADGPFPADRFTIFDPTQNTCERVSLPKPDCSIAHNDCVELDEVNKLDGFNTRTRLSIPFSGPLDISTIDSTSIFLVSLGDAMTDGVPSCLLPPAPECHLGEDDDGIAGCAPPPADAGWIVGINQVLWDPGSNTIHAETDEMLRQHTRYALIVTRRVHDVNGNEVAATQEFKRAISDDDDKAALAPDVAAYYASLRRAITVARFAGIRRHDIVAASVFTTLSVTAVFEKLREYVRAQPNPAASFDLGPDGLRTVFPRSSITKYVFNRQLTVNGALSAQDLTSSRFRFLDLVPGSVATVAFGKFTTPFFLNPDTTMATFGTFSGTPVPTGTVDVHFNLYIPAGTKPSGGWPVLVYAYVSGDFKDNSSLLIASKLAAHGIATIVPNITGHGFGPKGTLSITRTGATPATVTFPAGGRAVDVDGNGQFSNIEGSQAVGDLRFVTQNRDGQRQNLADVTRLIQVIQNGIDFDGDGQRDLDPNRIYGLGWSLSAPMMLDLFALDPSIRAATFGGMGAGAAAHASPFNRPQEALFFQARVPSLINPPGAPVITELGGVAMTPPHFNENIPERDRPVLVNDVAGALPIQEFIERAEWVQATHSPGPYAPFLRLAPLPGNRVRPFYIDMMRGDQNVPNPGTSTLARLGDFADRVVMYRHDLFANHLDMPNPHILPFLVFNTPPSMVPLAIQAQEQLATFFETDGATLIDPDGAGSLFEVPASLPLPDTFGFILK